MTDWRKRIDGINNEAEEITWAGIPDEVMNVITEENVNEAISALSGMARERFLDFVRYISLADGDIVQIGGHSADGKLSAEEWQKIRIVRTWARSHPMPERSVPFPVELAKGLLSRVDEENRALIPLIVQNRRHPQRARFDRTASACADLEKALIVTVEFPTNAQAQAYAWDLLGRALRMANQLIELTEEEQQLLNQQQNRILGEPE